MVNHHTQEDAKRSHTKAFTEVQRTRRWMAAVWSVKGGKLSLNRTTWNFPLEDFAEAVLLLHRECE